MTKKEVRNNTMLEATTESASGLQIEGYQLARDRVWRRIVPPAWYSESEDIALVALYVANDVCA